MKLDFTNYIVWKHQIVVILEAYAMTDFLEESCVAPDPFLKDSSGNFTRVKSRICQLEKQRASPFYFHQFYFITISPSHHCGSEICEGSLEYA